MGTSFLDSKVLENGDYMFEKSVKFTKGSLIGKYEFSIKVKDVNRNSAGAGGSFVFEST